MIKISYLNCGTFVLIFRFHLDFIIKLGPIVNDQYEYSIVTDPAAAALFVLARDPETFDMMYDAEVREYLLVTGFTTPPTQPVRVYHGKDCRYFSPRA